MNKAVKRVKSKLEKMEVLHKGAEPFKFNLETSNSSISTLITKILILFLYPWNFHLNFEAFALAYFSHNISLLFLKWPLQSGYFLLVVNISTRIMKL